MENLLLINPQLEKEKIVTFLKKTFKEQSINKVVLGLSGGIDSATALFLLKEVLPPENIFAVQMDYNPRKKSDIDLGGVNLISVPIKNIVDKFEEDIVKANMPFLRQSPGAPIGVWRSKKTASSFLIGDSQLKIRLGNIMARVRMIILFDLAKKLSALVCGTENKSERLLGYFTRFGDSASDVEPISHLYKTQVYQLAKYLKIPNEIINQPPTAGLWDKQTDEDDFGFSYKEADQVIYLVNEREEDIKKVKNLFPNTEKIIKLIQKNQFKQKAPYFLK